MKGIPLYVITLMSVTGSAVILSPAADLASLDAPSLVTAVGGTCAGLCDTLACHNFACSGGSKTVGSGDYYICNNKLNSDLRCQLGEPEDCYTSYWNCTAGTNCEEGCTFTVFRKPRSCWDD